MSHDRARAPERSDVARVRARDAALRRSRIVIGGVAAGAVVSSGVLSAVAAQAFKGHARRTATPAPARQAPPHRRARRIHVPRPQPIPQIGSAAPLQPPASPPSATPPPSAPAPAPTAAAPAPTAAPPAPAPAAPPQVSGGS